MLRLLEHYTSVQGEGPKTGVLTQFVRFAGCNLTCALWPCDTPEAIDPKLYRTEQQNVSPLDIRTTAESFWQDEMAYNVCLTGGEPMLQNKTALDVLVTNLRTGGFEVEMFSNGTLHYTRTVLETVDIVMDWKLPGSGEDPHNAVRIQNLQELINASGTRTHTIKFTCASEDDLHAAVSIYEQHNLEKRWPSHIYIGPVWGKLDPKAVVEFMKAHQLDWKLNLQTHKYIYGNVRSV